ncbi:MAG TPA: prepilin-type N-terminal cleavage/methylation domain-containing protein [Thermoanaerobaculia bacterium]|nr:prepilin-type N-terminal cleavage/methylation domain-containing protein [Thermoanaerobaculia bacterium]
MSMSVPNPGRRLPQRAPRGGRGFSLAELLVVILILSILFVVGGREIAQAWKRQKLQSASTDIKILVQRALPEMQRLNMQTFVQVGPLVTAGASRYLPIYLIGDANGNGGIDPFANPPTVAKPDLLIAEYDLIVKGLTGTRGTTGVNQEFSLSGYNVATVQSNLWLPPAGCGVGRAPFCDDDNWTLARAVMCDFQGRAIGMVPGAAPPPDPVSGGAQLAAPATLVLTHVDMVTGALAPKTRYVLSINPVWSVRVQKQIQDATLAWVDQQGG